MPGAQDINTWIQDAARAANAGELGAAKAMCERILAQEPVNLAGLQILGQVELRLNNFAGGVEVLRRALQLSPKSKQTAMPLAQGLTLLGDYAGAIGVFEQLVQHHPESVVAYTELVTLYRKTGSQVRGLQFLTALDRQYPGLAPNLAALAHLARDTGALVDAVSYGETAMRKDPASWNARLVLATAHLNLGRYPQAVALLQACASLPGLPPAEQTVIAEMIADAEMVAAIRPCVVPAPSAGIRSAWEREAVAALTPQLDVMQPAALNVVFFHVAAAGTHPYLRAAGDVDYTATLTAACAAAHRICANARVMVLTDTATDLSALPAWVQVLQLNADPAHMMYSRMSAYRALVMTGALTAPTLFLDTDVCLARDFAPVFDGSFDVALTYRTQYGVWHMPLNEGMILVAGGASSQAAQFFGESLALYEHLAEHPAVKKRYGFSIKTWRGGQLSLAALTDWQVPPYAAATQTLRGVRYRFIDSEQFNYPAAVTDTMAHLAQKWAIHFKGAAAKKMIARYQAFVSG